MPHIHFYSVIWIFILGLFEWSTWKIYNWFPVWGTCSRKIYFPWRQIRNSWFTRRRWQWVSSNWLDICLHKFYWFYKCVMANRFSSKRCLSSLRKTTNDWLYLVNFLKLTVQVGHENVPHLWKDGDYSIPPLL